MATKKAINLMRGSPNNSLLPVELLKVAARKALSDESVAFPGLAYGPDPGYEPFREATAGWLTAFYKPTSPITSSRIVATGGASQNLGCMLGVFTDPEYTRNIWIVAPAYFLAFRIFEDAGFARKMQAVPEDEEGLNIEYLRKGLAESEDRAKKHGTNRPRYKRERKGTKIYKNIIYCVPTFSNPSSRTMSLERRRELVRLARDHDALVISDDVYDFLQWPAEATSGKGRITSAHLPRLVDIDRTIDLGAERDGADGFGNACSNGSFSKIAGPGIRVGWAEGTEKLAYAISQAGTTKSGGAPSQLTSTYITPLLTSGSLQNHIDTILRPAYASRYNIMIAAITDHLIPHGFVLPQPTRDVVGGYFTWLSLPASLSAEALAKRCQSEENVTIAPGPIFEVNERLSFGAHIRLCWAWEVESDLEEGVKRIGAVAKRMIEEISENSDGYVVVGKHEAAQKIVEDL